MKNKLRIVLKFTTLSIVFLFFVLGIYAGNRYHKTLDFYNTGKAKTLLRKKTLKNDVSAQLIKDKVVLKKQDSEELMFDINPDKKLRNQRHFEEWMYDEYFWQIKIPEWEQEPTEEPHELEDWMFNMELKLAGCIDACSDSKEHKWMKSHSFFIL